MVFSLGVSRAEPDNEAKLQICTLLSTCVLLAQAAQAHTAGAQLAEKKAAAAEDDDEVDPHQYYERRVKAVKTLRDAKQEPYPHKFHVSREVPDFVAKYKGLEAGAQVEDVTESLAGALSASCHTFYKEMLNPGLPMPTMPMSKMNRVSLTAAEV